MRIEMPEHIFFSYLDYSYEHNSGRCVRPTFSDAVGAFFRGHGFEGTVEVVSVHRGWAEIVVTGDLPDTFSTNGQAHGTVFYRKVG